MSEKLISSVLDWSPWLEGDFPDHLAGIDRDYDLSPMLDLPEIKVLEGARRVGKSTLLYQQIRDLCHQNKAVVYLNFDDEVLSQHSLKDIYLAYTQQKPLEYLFLDEIQHCKEWVHFVRKMYDTKGIQQIWISGSNASLIKDEYKTLLTGRNITLHVQPLSFAEFLSFKGMKDIAGAGGLSSNKENKIKALFESYLYYGAFPAMALRDFYHKELLINYFEDILYKDIVARYDANPHKVKEVGLYLATNSAKTISYRKLAVALNMHPKTVSDYVAYFLDVFLFSELYRFDYSLKRQIASEKKIYPVDTGIARANSFAFSNERGRLLEMLVHNELKRRACDIYFHKQKKECDFIVKEGLKIGQAIQVCYDMQESLETRQREIAGLIEALEYFELEQGLILTLSEEDEFEFPFGGKTYYIRVKPVWKWLLGR